MKQFLRPAVDPLVVSAFGVTRSGQPVSYNRAPAIDLAPWIARLSVTQLHMPEGHTLECGMFADTAALRIQLAGCFEVHTRNGWQQHGRSAIATGPHSRVMPLRATGEFISVAVTLRPSACTALMNAQVSEYIDRVVTTTYRSPDFLLELLEPDGTPEDWLCALESLVREHISELKGAQPDPITARFEEIAFVNPTMSIAQAAQEIGVDRRRLERLVVRDFGMPPKQVLKRARALDMASQLRGVADPDEAEAHALRYYDESHLIREFIDLFRMSPRRFAALPQPMLTLALEARQARRLEMIHRLEAGAARPWG